MTHPTSPTRRRARDKRPGRRRYRLTPLERATLLRVAELRRAVAAADVDAKNRQAFAQLRAVNSALIVAGLLRRPEHKKP